MAPVTKKLDEEEGRVYTLFEPSHPTFKITRNTY